MKKKYILVLIIMMGLFIITGCNNDASNNESNNNAPKDVEVKKEITQLKDGDTIKNDNYEMKVESLSFKNELKYKVSSNYTKSVSIDNGKYAITLPGKFKNLMSDKIDTWNIKCKVNVDGKYNYDCSFHAWDELDPLVNANIVMYAEVPMEIKDSYSKIELTFGFNSDF